MKLHFWLILTLVASVAGGLLTFACGDDDDDDDDVAADDDDDTDDDTDDDDDDVSDDDDDDDDDETWEGDPWYGCTENDVPSDATVVTAFENVYHYYGAENNRSIDAEVAFPESGSWDQVTMRLELGCPEEGHCDSWDRLANVFWVKTVDETEEVVELARYITPYRTTMCFLVDVTQYAALLKGTQTIRSNIDTWVGPDSGFSDGNGWTVTMQFVFHPANKSIEDIPDHVVMVWPYATAEIGNPDNTVTGQLGAPALDLPDTISKAQMRVMVTGHGQGNKSNCAEFCPHQQKITLNSKEFKYNPWRNDCSENPIGPKQQGTWTYSRAGWCPGAVVLPETFDVTNALQVKADNEFIYEILTVADELYENTCRPGAGDEENYCEGCTFNGNPGNCDYNGGNHTTPVDKIAVQLFIWE